MKKQYIVVYDYGMGGLWAVISARSEQEIRQKYPKVEIMETRPGWMSDTHYNNIVSRDSFDIDEAPHGWLKNFEAK